MSVEQETLKTLNLATLEHPILWVKADLNQLVRDIRAAIQQFGNDLSNHEPLIASSEKLHQLNGVLQMLNFYGAALLAEDMELTVRAILAKRISRIEDAYETLVYAVFSMESYLDRLYHRQADVPLALLPILNDLRAAREEPFITESALFSPDLSIVPLIPSNIADQSDIRERLTENAKHLRPYYQAALLAWYRNPTDAVSLRQMKRIVRNLESTSYSPRIRQLWWIASGLIEALNEKGLDSNVSLRLLLGQLDRKIKQISSTRHEDIEQNPPIELIKNLLYYIAQSSSHGEVGSVINSIYNLEHILPSEEELSQAKTELHNPDAKTFATIARELDNTLQKAKTILDTFAREEFQSPDTLGDAIVALKHVADTLSLIGRGKERHLLQTQIEKLRAVTNGNTKCTNELLMEIAAATLHIENALIRMENEDTTTEKHLAQNREDAEMKTTDFGKLPEIEYRQLVSAAVKEAHHNIIEVKNAVLSALTGTVSRDKTDKIPELLNQIKGCLRITKQVHASDLVANISRYISEKIINASHMPDKSNLDLLAEAIVGIEYFLEAAGDDKSSTDQILALTRRSLHSLGYPVEAPIPDKAQRPALGANITRIDMIAKPPLKSNLITAIGSQEVKKHEPEKAVKQEKTNVVTLPVDEPDDEVKEIFIEELKEQREELHSLLETLKLTRYDAPTLEIIRRCFHTLKGSGKIANAHDIGEHAGQMDHFVNQLILHTAIIDDATLALIGEGVSLLDNLLVNYQKNTPAKTLVDNFSQRILAAPVVESHEEQHTTEPVVNYDNASLFQDTEILDEDEPVAQRSNATVEEIRATEAANNHAHAILDSIEDFIAHQAQSSTLTLLPATVAEGISNLDAFAKQGQDADFKRTTELLRRYSEQLLSAGEKLTHETLGILQDFCETARALIAEPETEHVEIIATDTNPSNAMDKPITRVAPTIPVLSDISKPASFDSDLDDDLDLIDIFLEEAEELFEEGYQVLETWPEDGITQDALNAMQRVLHTLKGSARMAGMTAIGNITHAIETLIERAHDNVAPVADTLRELVQQALDALSAMVEAATNNQDIPTNSDLLDKLNAVSNTLLQRESAKAEPDLMEEAPQEILPEESTETSTIPVAIETTSETSEESKSEITTAEIGEIETPAASPIDETVDEHMQYPSFELEKLSAHPPEETEIKTSAKGDSIRINADLLDKLVNASTEQATVQLRASEQVNVIKSHLSEMDKAIKRLKDQLRDVEFGSEAKGGTTQESTSRGTRDLDMFSKTQETAKRLIESVDDIENLQGLITQLALETDNLGQQQQKLIAELHDGLLSSRMISFANQTQRLQRIVRQVSSELGKKAEIVLTGTEGALDKSLLDKLMGPIEHMVRNAMVHGIETPAARKSAGKNETGKITLSFQKEKSDNVIQISDDGAGLDPEKIRAKAISMGLIKPTDELAQADILNLIMESGFSTADSITQLAGRGVGMDVVYTEVQNLGGSLFIDTQKNKGTTFIIRLPFTMAVKQTLLVKAKDSIYAVPSTMIDATLPMRSEQLEAIYQSKDQVIEHNGDAYPLWYLETLLNGTPAILPPAEQNITVLLLRVGERKIALHIDRVLDTKDTVLKPTGPQLSKIAGISGATILADGKVVLILDIPMLVDAGNKNKSTVRQTVKSDFLKESDTALNVLVIDDSITVRKVTERFLKRYGIEVSSAKDGLEALENMEQNKPDIILLDIEMPRMDGLEFAENLRKNEKWKNIPVIMITSRSGKKHRDIALSLGVKIFMSKPYQEAELLKNIRELANGKLIPQEH